LQHQGVLHLKNRNDVSMSIFRLPNVRNIAENVDFICPLLTGPVDVGLTNGIDIFTCVSIILISTL
jgi:hypothetical protein